MPLSSGWGRRLNSGSSELLNSLYSSQLQPATSVRPYVMTNQGQKPGLFQLEILGVFFFTLRVYLQTPCLSTTSEDDPLSAQCTSATARKVSATAKGVKTQVWSLMTGWRVWCPPRMLCVSPFRCSIARPILLFAELRVSLRCACSHGTGCVALVSGTVIPTLFAIEWSRKYVNKSRARGCGKCC
eukprot:312775-Prorocentrum_minimum.AAC.1